MKVQEYIKEDGSNPYQKWFDNLDAIAAAKVTVAKSRLELGNTSNIKWFDGIIERAKELHQEYKRRKKEAKQASVKEEPDKKKTKKK